MIDTSFSKFYYLSGNVNDGKFIDLDGVENLNITESTSFTKNYILGGIDSSALINSPIQIEISFDRSFIQKDFLFSFTGENPISKINFYNGYKYYELNDLYLNSYSANFTVGDLPKIGTKWTSYGNRLLEMNSLTLNNNVPIQTISLTQDIPKINSISISGNYGGIKDFNTIYSFDYSVSINRQPYFSIGSTSAKEVCPILPLEISMTISSRVSASQKDQKIDPLSEELSFDILVSGVEGIMNFPIRKVKQVSEDVSMVSRSIVEIKRNFIGSYGL
jgi:hypothetical protein